MRMYVGNASIQTHIFTYTLKGDNKQRTIYIPPMTQRELPDKDMSQDQITAIVDQHQRYGFAGIDEIKSMRLKKVFTRLCYSIDRAISSLMIQTLFDLNQGIKTDEGKILRKNMAIAADNSVIETLENQKKTGQIHPETAVDGFEMVIQEDALSDLPRPEKDMVSEGIIVEPNPGSYKHSQHVEKKAQKARRKR